MRVLRYAPLFLLLACEGPVGTDAGGGTPDAGHDASLPPPQVREELPTPGTFMAGSAVVRVPAPLGIGTMGFAAIGEDPSPTPFSEQFPGTTRVHGELTFRAVALSRGDAFEAVFVRMDTIGVFQQLREAVLDELEARLGRSLNDSLILAANHTHSGPGRLLMTSGALVALGDVFFPEFYDRVVQSLADVVERALADLAPAELGTATAQSSEGHTDRRCENDSLDQVQEVPDPTFGRGLPLPHQRADGVHADGGLDGYVHRAVTANENADELGLDDASFGEGRERENQPLTAPPGLGSSTRMKLPSVTPPFAWS